MDAALVLFTYSLITNQQVIGYDLTATLHFITYLLLVFYLRLLRS